MKNIFANLMLSIASAFFFFLLLEFVIFRFIFLAPDIASPDFVDGVIRYQSGQTGVSRVKNEIEAKFQINDNGWNSKYKHYQTEKNPDKFRVAMIGDSYIAAFQVDHNNSVAEKLESKLGDKAEVYRFGIDGAPLSQYLHMLREEVLNYNPDLVVINVVHNDFNESYSFVSGVLRSAFLKYEIQDGKVTKEILPIEYKAPWYGWIREKSATWKYLSYRQQIHFGVLRDMILGDDNDVEYHANIDTSSMEKDQINNYLTADYSFRKMKQLCDERGIKLVVIMDADDQIIYERYRTGKTKNDTILQLNQIVAEVAKKNNIPIIDLQSELSKDYAINKKRFSFINDAHWNEYAHGLVADLVFKKISMDF